MSENGQKPNAGVMISRYLADDKVVMCDVRSMLWQAKLEDSNEDTDILIGYRDSSTPPAI